MYYNNILDYNKKTWRVINEILSNKHQKNSNNIPLKVTVEYNCNHEDPIAISNVFNTYFAKVGSTLASKIPAPTINKMQNMHSVEDSFFLHPIIETEVALLLRNLRFIQIYWTTSIGGGTGGALAPPLFFQGGG